jgi:hypothetical protein
MLPLPLPLLLPLQLLPLQQLLLLLLLLLRHDAGQLGQLLPLLAHCPSGGGREAGACSQLRRVALCWLRCGDHLGCRHQLLLLLWAIGCRAAGAAAAARQLLRIQLLAGPRCGRCRRSCRL